MGFTAGGANVSNNLRAKALVLVTVDFDALPVSQSGRKEVDYLGKLGRRRLDFEVPVDQARARRPLVYTD